MYYSGDRRPDYRIVLCYALQGRDGVSGRVREGWQDGGDKGMVVDGRVKREKERREDRR